MLSLLFKLYKKNAEEINEEDPNFLLKIFYEALIVFYMYYFFHLFQLLIKKAKVTDFDEYRKIISKDQQLPLKFQVKMACVFETLFGIIGLGIIFLGKSFTYAFYHIFIYIVFLIIRVENGEIDDRYYDVRVKLSVFDYIISIIMLLLTIVCLCFVAIRKF